MFKPTHAPLAWVSAMLAMALAAATAHAAPGEDTVTISNRVSYLQMPTSPLAKSGHIEFRQDIPDDLAAKASRYTAKAYSPDVGNVKTERDVVQSVKTTGTQTTCYQSVGSTSAVPTGAGGTVQMGDNEQIVVLRGDLINICN
ncbi:hypothetical protein [Ottowia sp.]|uniref:hypothetical protein n=1 Tax=Ottowia sp. TaxID=1898956 RepID=UPI003A85D299